MADLESRGLTPASLGSRLQPTSHEEMWLWSYKNPQPASLQMRNCSRVCRLGEKQRSQEVSLVSFPSAAEKVQGVGEGASSGREGHNWKGHALGTEGDGIPKQSDQKTTE